MLSTSNTWKWFILTLWTSCWGWGSRWRWLCQWRWLIWRGRRWWRRWPAGVTGGGRAGECLPSAISGTQPPPEEGQRRNYQYTFFFKGGFPEFSNQIEVLNGVSVMYQSIGSWQTLTIQFQVTHLIIAFSTQTSQICWARTYQTSAKNLNK